MSCPRPDRLPLLAGAALILALTAGMALPAAAQEIGCGKMYENMDCGMPDLEAAARRVQEAEAAAKRAEEEAAAAAANPQTKPGELRQRAMELYRARMATQSAGLQCCHPNPDGSFYCH
ncbi:MULTISPECIES: hypothetical protein [unclassified Azospirillum]|uniref:hypothetical protein n=1 Tax=unclassified Azospirillum TaxID=2630922 RepID=UPI000B70CBD2|nr:MULTISPECIES: hypothetical protein [unclassified Azospirillum]SNS16826.1 hypothetical protein SAMN05880556_102285 [Azospirillum sp. RU38E]SNS34111.1 hypothetical protein SAMN05880591_102285 [Azospirillum sp. RU37A]